MDGDKSRPTSYARFSAKSQHLRRSITPLDFRKPPEVNFAVRQSMDSRSSPQIVDLAPRQSTSRPITQHGVEGMPAPPSSHFQKRTHFDTKYYITAIQSHMNRIQQEMANLNSRTAKQKPASATLTGDRKIAQEEAKVYAKYQQQLSALNIALEMHLSRISNEQAVSETAEINKKNAGLAEELDHLFLRKTRFEEILNSLEEDLKQENMHASAVVEMLPPKDVPKYMSYSKENQQYIRQITKMQGEISRIKSAIADHKQNMAYSAKQQRVDHLMQLDASKAHKRTLRGRLEDVPLELERNNLLKKVKEDKIDAEALQKVKVNLEEQLHEKNEQLNGLNQELDSKNSARLKKYRDVHVRHAQVNNYIEKFDDVAANVRSGIAEKEKEIAQALDYLSEKMTEDNFQEIDELENDTQPENLIDEYKILTARLARLKDMLPKQVDELQKLTLQERKMRGEMETFKDIEWQMHELETQTQDEEENQKVLKTTLSVTVSAVNKSKARLAQFENLLEKDDTYREFVVVGKQLEELEQDNEKLEEEIKSGTHSEEVNVLLNEVDEQTKKVNEKIIEKLKNKKKDKH